MNTLITRRRFCKNLRYQKSYEKVRNFFKTFEVQNHKNLVRHSVFPGHRSENYFGNCPNDGASIEQCFLVINIYF